jgi:arsenate reductase
MIKIYHNPRCSKSRQGVQLLEESGQPFEIIKYLDTKLSKSALMDILDLLEIAPLNLVRKGEKVWKEHYKGKDLSDSEIVAAMVKHPKLIERPIVINKKQGIIGRPPENIKSIL